MILNAPVICLAVLQMTLHAEDIVIKVFLQKRKRFFKKAVVHDVVTVNKGDIFALGSHDPFVSGV